MAIEQNRHPESLERPLRQPAERGVIGAVACLYPVQRLGDRHTAGVDFLRFGDEPRDRAEAGRHPQRARVHMGGQLALEHAGIELERLAIDVEIGPRKPRPRHGRAERQRAGEEFVDIGVLGSPQRGGVEPGTGQETAGIDGAGVRRGQHEGVGRADRLDDFDRRGEFRLQRSRFAGFA